MKVGNKKLASWAGLQWKVCDHVVISFEAIPACDA